MIKLFLIAYQFMSMRSINQTSFESRNFSQELQYFYLITVLTIFIFAMILQIPKLNIDGNIKLAVFVAWAIYGVLPTLHWTIAMGGFDNPIVKMLIPRVMGMYVINAIAFAFYMFKIPERFYPGNLLSIIITLIIITQFYKKKTFFRIQECEVYYLLNKFCLMLNIIPVLKMLYLRRQF